MISKTSISGRQVIASAGSYAAAFLVTTLLHELAHFGVALGWDRDPVLYHNAVRSAAASSVAARVSTSLAGPLLSLVQGLFLVWLERRLRALDPARRLFLMWLAFHGLMNATGYLFTTAFVPDADLGSAARLLGVPMVGLIALSALGFWSIRVGAGLLYPGFVALLPLGCRADVGLRNRGLLRLCVLAWPLGVLLVLPATFPIPHWISLLYVLIAGIGSIWFTDFSKARGHGVSAGGRPLTDRLALGPWILWLLLTALCLLVLRHGVSFS